MGVLRYVTRPTETLMKSLLQSFSRGGITCQRTLVGDDAERMQMMERLMFAATKTQTEVLAPSRYTLHTLHIQQYMYMHQGL